MFEGKTFSRIGQQNMRELRREMQIIFQDPYASLNPRMNMLSIVGEPMNIHGIGNKT